MKQKGCDYCLKREDIIDEICQRPETGIRKNYLNVYINKGELCAEGDMGFMFMRGNAKINYCPNCSRKLESNNENN